LAECFAPDRCDNSIFMTKQQLLGEVDELLRVQPTGAQLADVEWLGRAAAVIERWNVTKVVWVSEAMRLSHVRTVPAQFEAKNRLVALLHQARADLRMEVGQLSVVVPEGQVFDYFDEVRKVIETARGELFFVDPYLTAEFVSRYLPHVAQGCGIRLLTAAKSVGSLLPAVDLFAAQSGAAVGVRVSGSLHDRYVFVDKATCYLSGASFKDGAKKAPAVLTQVTDAFQPMFDTYEKIWTSAKVER
jgi:hypothetical protein